MPELSPEARVVLNAAGPHDAPSASDRARMDRRLAALGVATTAASAATTAQASVAPSASAAPGAVASSAALKVVALAVALLAAGLGARLLPRAASSPSPRTTRAPERAVVVAVRVAPSQETQVAPRDAIRAPEAPAAAVAAEPAVANTAERARTRAPVQTVVRTDFAAEVALLREAHAALREGRPADALAQLARHDAEHQGGALREEFLAARVVALCGLGREAEARAEATRLRRESPGSPMVERLRTSCAAAPSEP